jgi:hypothetical protein
LMLGFIFEEGTTVRSRQNLFEGFVSMGFLAGICAGFVFAVILYAFVGSRIYLVVESFASLCSLPFGADDTP